VSDEIEQLHKKIAYLTEQAERWEDDALRLMKERNEALGELRKAETECSMLRVECGVIAKERDEARREVCFLLSRNVTQGCDGDTPEFHATARGWCYLLEEDDE
jgi:hypothetical protein